MPEREGDPQEALRRAHQRIQGMGLLADLETYSAQERLAAIRKESRFQHWGLFDRLLTAYLEQARNHPQAGIDYAELALAVLDKLPTGRYPPPVLADFRAEGMAALASARRLAGSFKGARAALRSAWEHLGAGTGDPLIEANVISIEASLHRDLGQFEQAAATLRRAVEIYQEVGEANRCAHILIQQATAIGKLDPAEGVRLLQGALGLLDPAEEPRLELCARHNMALFLDDAGEPTEALEMLEMTRPLYRVFSDRHTQLLLHWLEARIARSLGDFAEAEALLQKVWRAFEERGMRHEQTLASIDLVEVHGLRGNFEAAEKLATEFQRVLASWGMHSEGQALWMLFGRSVAEHARMQATLATEAFREVARYFHRAWNRPMEFGGREPS